jgi:hypothetical protein
MTDTQPGADAIERDREQGDGQRRPDQGSDASPTPAQIEKGPATGGEGAAGAGGPGGFGT